MKKEEFEKLVVSVKEAGEIKAGRKAPSRVFEIKPPESQDCERETQCVTK